MTHRRYEMDADPDNVTLGQHLAQQLRNFSALPFN